MPTLVEAQTYQRQGGFQRAEAAYTEILKSDPSNLPALANCATLLAKRNKLVAAETMLKRVTEQAPYDADQWIAFGNVLARRGKFLESRHALSTAMDLRPENPDIYINLAMVAYQQRNYKDAEEFLYKVMALGLDTDRVRFDLAHSKMGQADLEMGLLLYENRWATLEHSPAWDYHIPEWQGEDLTGKHILVHEEQGFGDTIMTSRFICELSAREITLAVHRSIMRLFSTQEWGGIRVVDLADLPPNSNEIFDFHSPLFSIMRHLNVSRRTIDPQPYLLSTNQNAFPVPKSGLLDVGICWASGDRGERKNARRRVTDLDLWLPLSGIHNVRLWSLQKEGGREAISQLSAEALIVDVMASVSDWADTASLVSQLDLVISVDTGVVHLAGALGVPVWMLSQYSPCWRWWDIEQGTGQPWYEDMRIYWQHEPDDWKPLLASVEADLEVFTRDLSLPESGDVRATLEVG